MGFELRAKGNSIILEYSLGQDQKVDHDTLAMLSNNEIPGIIQPVFSQYDDNKLFEYDITELTSAADFFREYQFYKQNVLSILKALTATLAAAEGHLIGFKQFAVDLRHVYFDESLMPCLICVPVEDGLNECSAHRFLLDVMQAMEKNPGDDFSYVAELYEYLSNGDGFSFDGFRTLMGSMSLSKGSKRDGESVRLRSLSSLDPVEQGNRANFKMNEIGPIQGVDNVVVPRRCEDFAESPSVPRSFGGMMIPSVGGIAPAVAGEANYGGGLSIPPSGNNEKEPSLGGLLSGRDSTKKEKRPKKEKASERRKKDKKEGEAVPKKKKGGLFGLFGKDDKDVFEIPRGTVAPMAVPGIENDDKLPDPNNSPFFDSAPTPSNFGVTQVHGVKKPIPKKDSCEAGKSIGQSRQPIEPESYATGQSGTREAETPIDHPQNAPSGSMPFAQVKQVSTGDSDWVDRSPYRLGRKRSEVDFYLPNDLNISRVHALIIFEDGDFFLSDNASGNHTYANGRMLKAGERYRLSDGDEFSLGDEKFLFVCS